MASISADGEISIFIWIGIVRDDLDSALPHCSRALESRVISVASEVALDEAWHIDQSEDAENAMAWLQGIGSGAASGAATGAAAGPWGALIGGAVGAGLGALSTHQQQQQQRRGTQSRSRRPAAPQSAQAPRTAAPASRTAARAPGTSSARMASPRPGTPLSSGRGDDVLDELRRLLPALRSLAAAALATGDPGAPSDPSPTTQPAAVPPSETFAPLDFGLPEFARPVPAWEAAESVERALAEHDHQAIDEAAIGHVHPQPHPAARHSSSPSHPLHDVHRAISSIARGGRRS